MTAITGDDIREAFASGAKYLELYRESINALNVFPVPDGDTGTNMLLTMRSALERCSQEEYATAEEAIGDLADGAFWGARGNGGVILSQFLKGFADGSAGLGSYRGPDLGTALAGAQTAAYGAVGQPVEGTMLTVIRSLAEHVEERLQEAPDSDSRDLWQSAFSAGRDALARTPDMLPVLREAGVVDAGGMGILVLWGGALCHLVGLDEEELKAVLDIGYVPSVQTGRDELDNAFLEAIEEVEWGYCTQFVITGEGLSPDGIRHHLSEIYQSAVIIGNDRNVRVHLHALDPGPPLSYGATVGQLSHIEIQNMTEQNVDFVSGHRESRPASPLAVVAVAVGDGLAQIFRETGCAVVVSGGQTMNPSVAELVEAVQAANARETILLPNNKNIVVSAEQAQGRISNLHVVPTTTVPQGVAALLSFNPEGSLESNLDSMGRALSEVVTIEVTRAVRDSTIGGVDVVEGQIIGLVDGDLTVASNSPEETLRLSLESAGLCEDMLVTLYLGEDGNQDEADTLVGQLEAQVPGVQIEMVYGGQPHYHYLASIE